MLDVFCWPAIVVVDAVNTRQSVDISWKQPTTLSPLPVDQIRVHCLLPADKQSIVSSHGTKCIVRT